MRHTLVPIVLALLASPAIGCDLVPPSRPPTIAELLGGTKELFGGTVVGYVLEDGRRLLGPLPRQCVDGEGSFRWWEEMRSPECSAYPSTTAALFRVDVPIVGPAAGDIATYEMTWGDGDCNIDFAVGETWLIADRVVEELRAPIRKDQIAALRRLAAEPAFDFSQLYR